MGKLKPHVIAVPYPAQGHVIPLLEVAQRLAKNGVKITFLNSEFIHERVIKALPPENAGSIHELISLVSIPDGLEPWEERNDFAKLTEAMLKNMPGKLEDLLKDRLMEKGNDERICILADYFLGWAMEVAEKLGLKKALFLSASVALMGYTSHSQKLADNGIFDENGTPYKNEVIQMSPDMPEMSTMNFAWSCALELDARRILFQMILKNIKSTGLADWLICNTFNELEAGALALFPKCSPIGPLLSGNHEGKHGAGSFWLEDSSCLQWLDQQPPRSVIYVAFGSFTIFDQTQFQELALGLQLANRPFLWVVRQDMIRDISMTYPDGFGKTVENVGKIVSWAPQQKVLSHPSIACFLTHCGWNSTMEGIGNGVPFLCWPYFLDQFIDKNYICDLWEVGLGFNKDEAGIIRKEEIKSKVEQLLSDERYKERVLKLQAQAMASGAEGGCSHKNFSKFVDWIKEN